MIEKFGSLKAVAIPLDRGNVDADAILPARFLKTVKRTGLGEGLFHAWRFDESGKEVPGFTLNMAPYRGGEVLVAGGGFGGGPAAGGGRGGAGGGGSARRRAAPEGVPPQSTRRDPPAPRAQGGDRPVRARREGEVPLAVPGYLTGGISVLPPSPPPWSQRRS